LAGLDRRTKIFGVKECRITPLLTDVAGAAATYSVAATTTTTTASTTTSIILTAGGGALLTAGVVAPATSIIGRAISIGGFVTGVTNLATDTLTVSPALATAPLTGVTVNLQGSVPVSGCKALLTTPTMVTVDLRGDNTFLDTDTVLTALGIEIDAAKHSFDIWNTMLGGAVATTGSTPNQVMTWSLLTQPSFGYFMLEARCFTSDLPTGDVHLFFNKVKAADAPIPGLTEENYNMPKIKCKTVPPKGTTPWLTVVMNETAIPCL
jgi:hypothetical protein